MVMTYWVLASVDMLCPEALKVLYKIATVNAELPEEHGMSPLLKQE